MIIQVNRRIDAVLAIDPGPELSAYMVLSDGRPGLFAKIPNEQLKKDLRQFFSDGLPTLACEMIQAQGMGVGAETFETVFWTGRFREAWPGEFVRVYRRQVKSHICGSMKAKDKNIRQALIDKFGGDSRAIGGKKCPRCKGKCWLGRDHTPCQCNAGWLHPPGPLNGISADCWSALAIAVTWRETVFRTETAAPRSPAGSADEYKQAGGVGRPAKPPSAASRSFGFAPRQPSPLSASRPA